MNMLPQKTGPGADGDVSWLPAPEAGNDSMERLIQGTAEVTGKYSHLAESHYHPRQSLNLTQDRKWPHRRLS